MVATVTASALMGVASLAAPAARAEVTTLSTVVSADDATYPYRIGDGCIFTTTGSPTPEPRNYVVRRLTVSVPGTYLYRDRYSTGGVDMGLAVYPVGGFDPANPSARCITSGDDDEAFDLSSASSYTIVATTYNASRSGALIFTLDGPGAATLSAQSAGEASRDLSIWQQSHARATAQDPCGQGWGPTWMQWPNDGAGGWACVRHVYSYYPNEQVVG